MLQVALLSSWHVHTGGYAKFVQQQPDAKLTVIWDDDVERGKGWAEKLGIDFEPDLDRMLARDDVDAVVCDAPTSDHAKLLIRCAEAGKHIFTEKALAPTVEECKAVAEAVEKAGVKFCISFPARTVPANKFVKEMADSGKLGQISYLRFRNAHGGSSQGWLPEYWYDADKACGGAMMDLGCHPNYLASWILGKPVRVNSMFNTLCCPDTMEDNAVSVIEFENKAIAVLETSFVTPWSSPQVELYGTDGSVIVEDGGKVRYRIKGMDGWMTPDKLPDPSPMALRQFIDGVLYDKEIEFGMDAAIALTELLENEYKAFRSGKTVEIK
ncbi:MAG: Gfo/Idh/MocA family protein [Christensenellales bacterium]|jgi:1,5-anhydro-D-fructose reductase (1,5-anhydro-D-mannitol-forming)